MKNVKAIIFDAYGTLFDVNSGAEKCKDKIVDKWVSFASYWRNTQLEYTYWVNRNNNIFDNLDYQAQHKIKNLQ